MAAYGEPKYKVKMDIHLFDHPADELHNCLKTIDMSKGLPKSFFNNIDVED